MCGRLTQKTPVTALVRQFSVDADAASQGPLGDRAPSQDVLVIRRHPKTGACHLDPLRWGLIPNWRKGEAVPKGHHNARIEGIADKPVFRPVWASARRCLVPADCFIEWHRMGSRSIPHAFALASGEPMALAGLWDNWQQPDGSWLRTFTIITMPAQEPVSGIHHRMPLILGAELWPLWLGPGKWTPIGSRRHGCRA